MHQEQETPTTPTVLLTGATGFIGSHIAARLLASGYRVRAAVRSTHRASDLLEDLAGAEHLELVEADLQDATTTRGIADGCSYVIHTASPFRVHADDPQVELVDPAVNGTLAVLRAAAEAGSVQRVVVTSSSTAMTDEPAGVVTEADWNTTSTLDRNPYAYSKTQAERAAWSFVEQEEPGFDLITILPVTNLGPSIVPSISQSSELLVNLTDGTYPGVINLDTPIVDVRDTAEAHVLAIETPEASGRYLCAADTLSQRELIEALSELGHDYRYPRLPFDNRIGDFVVGIVARTQPAGIRSYLRTHIGRSARYDSSRITRDLGLVFRPVSETLDGAMADLERWGHLAPRTAA